MSFAHLVAVARRAYLAVELAPPELHLPAREDALAALERDVGHALPPALRKAWLAADGQESTPDAPLFWQVDDDERFLGHAFLSVAQALEARRSFPAVTAVDPAPRDARIADGWNLPGWLPFAESASGLLAIDLAPSPMGTSGQVIAFTRDPGAMTWISGSFDELLARSVAALETDPEDVLQEVGQDEPLGGRRERRDDRE